MQLAEFLKQTNGRDLVEPFADRLHTFVHRQRWFGGKARTIHHVAVHDAAIWQFGENALLFVLCRYVYADGVEYYNVPLFLGWWDTLGSTVEQAIAGIEVDGRELLVLDALELVEGRRLLAEFLLQTATQDRIRGKLTMAGQSIRERIHPDDSRVLEVEQSNSSAVYKAADGRRALLKLYRRVPPGPNPELEIGEFLTEHAALPNVPRLFGALEYLPEGGGEPWTLAVLQEFVDNQGDAWSHLLEILHQELADGGPPVGTSTMSGLRWSALSRTSPPEELVHRHRRSLQLSAEIGRCTAALHRALADATEWPSLAPEPVDAAYLEQLARRINQQVEQVLGYLDAAAHLVPESHRNLIETVRTGLPRVAGSFRAPAGAESIPHVRRIRVHGDYHLGQVLIDRDGGLVVIDFEGEPARSLQERRSRELVFKDVAGMLRSFDYAAHTVALGARHGIDEPWSSWIRAWCAAACGAFLSAYNQSVVDVGLVPTSDPWYDRMLNAFVLEKACYEVMYELNNRPDWVIIPLKGIEALVKSEWSEPS